MACENSFSCNASEWKIYQKTIATFERMVGDDQLETDLEQLIKKFNEITFHLAELPINNHDDLEQCMAIIKHLNAEEGNDVYMESIDKMLENVRRFLLRRY